MCNGKYLDTVRELFEHDVVRKVVYRKSPHGSSHERNPSTSRWKSFDQFEGSFDFGDEPVAHFDVPLPVPRGGLANVSASCTLNKERFQRRSTSDRISSSAPRQSVPRSSAASRDRRSISAAQAFSTSCSRSCKLANSSAARLALSSASRVRASSRIFLAVSVTGKLYQQPTTRRCA